MVSVTLIRSATLILGTLGGAILDTGAAGAETIDCNSANSTPEINFCADKDYQTADKDLNAAYAAAVQFVRNRKIDAPYDPKNFEAALRNAQRAWVAFRDTDCKELVPQQWSGGTGTTSAILQCMTEKTQQRTKELKALSTMN